MDGSVEVGPIEVYEELKAKGFITEAMLSSRTFSGYAPPMFFGGWVLIASHGGAVTYSINYVPLGDTVVVAEVRYASPNGERIQPFKDSISVTTGNFWGNVYVRFKGVPTGSGVHGEVSP